MDAYNANPTSMQASIVSFLSANQTNQYFVLGDMLELGEYSKAEHIAILELLKNYPQITVFTVGKSFAEIALNYNFKAFNNVGEFCLFLQKSPKFKGNLLIKGSRGIQLEKIIDYL